MSDEEHRYDTEVQPDNKLGHTLTLLSRHLPEDAQGGVHLDIACGFGHIAEPLVDQHGVEYIGVDAFPDGLEDLTRRGFETHEVDLSVPTATDALIKVLDGRRLVSITFLDGLEHMTDGSHALAAVGELLGRERAIGVLSVPNVTHMDVAIKAMLGQWTYTDVGLLDSTHYQLYSGRSLEVALRRAGLQRVEAHDVTLARSDQHFPADHVGLSESTSIGAWLRHVRAGAEPHSITNQFVWAVTSCPPRSDELDPREEDGPFLSVLMRTQGRRPQEMREALLCLAAQTSTDFEVIVVAHRTSLEEQKAVERIIEDQPPSFRKRIRLLLLDHGRRSVPLNVALREARGRYVGIFDDDDVVLANWVEAFRNAEADGRGRILRGVALLQNATVRWVRGMPGIKAASSPESQFSPEFSISEHLVANQSPPISWAFPRSLHLDFGLEFEESMTTTEDWEFLLRAVELTGVADLERVNSIYRWWLDRESSRTLHRPDEWIQNQAEIERRIDSRPYLLPAGESRELRRKLIRLKDLELAHEKAQKRLNWREKKVTRLEKRLTWREKKVARLEKENAALRKQVRLSGGQPGRPGAGGRSVPAVPPAQPPGRVRGLRDRLRLRTRIRSRLTRVR